VKKAYFASEPALRKLLESLEAEAVYASVRRERGAEYCNLKRAPAEAELALRDPRPSASPKSFLQPAKERVAVYSAEGVNEEESCPACGERVLVGMRGCDVKAMEYLDKVFREGEFADPFYEARRAADVLITVDCVAPHETCFCTALGGKPFVEAGFDLNITPLAEGYLLEVGTEKGQAVVGKVAGLLTEASEAQVRQRDAVRQKAVEKLEAQNPGLRITDQVQEVLLGKQGSEAWKEQAADCVECAACTFICPTCHCFYLYDQVAGPEEFERMRTWDSCILGDYSRMAGPKGAKPTPRPALRTRFANRVLHKYAFSPQQYALLGCTGCGRCIEACFGKIDIRQVLKELTGGQGA
jgi:ferredoxin